ncbi:hypothetical protein MMC34_004914 [Xylographa carneopallida]|nr:hypothetical protein [Xylographa carneopallida]
MSSFSSLPAEMVRSIVSKIDSSDTLSCVARTCHTLYDMTIPFLYDHIALYDREGGSGRHKFKNLRPLTILLLKRPDLARLVHHFAMRDAPSTGSSSEKRLAKGRPVFRLQADDVLKDAIKAASHDKDEEQQWLLHIKWPDHGDATLALLLPALPHLESLDLMLMYGCTYFDRMMRHAGAREKPFDRVPGFLALKDVMHTWYDEKYGMGVEYIVMFMRLPSIRRIFGHRIGSDDEFEGEAEDTLAALDTASSTVSHIELKDCKLHKRDLANMLRAPKALQTFIYQVGTGYLSECGRDFQASVSALAPQAQCLENLWLDFEPRYSSYWDSTIDDTTPIRSFAHFEHLKVLKVATVFIFGDKNFSISRHEDWVRSMTYGLTGKFPRSLEALHLLHCEDNFEHVLLAHEDMLDHKERDLPRLSKLVLEGPILEAKERWPRIRQIIQRGKAHGIDTITVNHARGNLDYNGAVERGWGIDQDVFWEKGVNALNRYPPNEVVDLQSGALGLEV